MVPTIHYAEFAAAEEIVRAALNDEHSISVQALTEFNNHDECVLMGWRVTISSPAGREQGQGGTLLEATARALKKCL